MATSHGVDPPAQSHCYFPLASSPSSTMRRIGLIIGHGRCPALICGLILDVADVCLEWRQPTHVDQAVVLAAINISSRVFTSAARDYSSKQLDVFVLHNRHLFRKPLDQAGRVLSQPARGESNRKRAEAFPKGDGLFRFHLRQTPIPTSGRRSPGRRVSVLRSRPAPDL